MTLENCPQCSKQLPPTLKSSGRQVCTSCGWSEQKNNSRLENSEPSNSEQITSKTKNNVATEQISKSFRIFASKSEYILLAILGLLVFNKFSKPIYEYTIASPSDSRFTESMSEYGAKGWRAVECRRAKDSITDDFAYECVMIREK